MIFLKTPEQIEVMNEANLIVHSVLDEAQNNIAAGMTTKELNDLMEAKLGEFDGATSAFKGYKGFPAVACISTNEEVVHGIPGNRVISSGDIVSVDFGVFYKGFAGDSARTFIVGEIDDETTQLVENTRQALWKGIEAMVPGNRLHDIGRAIGAVAKAHNYGNVKGFCGHGIDWRLHTAPHVFNYVEPKEPNVRLRAGMVLALEPMFNLGGSEVYIVEEDKWTVRTKDSKYSCHWELSVAITEDGPRPLGNVKPYQVSLY